MRKMRLPSRDRGGTAAALQKKWRRDLSPSGLTDDLTAPDAKWNLNS